MKSWKDIYELPIKDSYVDGDFRSGRIYDSAGNFVFMFTPDTSATNQEKLINVINGKDYLKNNDLSFRHESGNIIINGSDNLVIIIRGWGNLCGTGGHNLREEEAANVQDTFADFIVEQLNLRP